MDTRIAVVWNPSKTDRETLEEPLLAAGATDVQWWETSQDDPGAGATARALAADPSLVIVAGGDGTVRAVAEHLADVEARVDLGIVPLGTGNLLARNLDVPINDVPAAIERALAGTGTAVDVGWVEVDLAEGTERHAFVVMIGFGIDAHMIAETNEDLKSKAGWLAYVESLGRALSASDIIPFNLSVDDRPGRDEDGHTLLIANCGSLQGGVTLLPDADPSDGELDFLLLSAESFGEWMGTLKTMAWDNGIKRLFSKSEETVDGESVTHGRARSITVTLREPRPFEIDGEEIGATSAFRVSIQPGGVRVR